MKKKTWKIIAVFIVVSVSVGLMILFRPATPVLQNFENILFVEPGVYRLVRETDSGQLIEEDYRLTSESHKVIIDKDIKKAHLVQIGINHILYLPDTQIDTQQNG